MPAPSQASQHQKHIRTRKGIILLSLLILVSVSVFYIIRNEESRLRESITGHAVQLEDNEQILPEPEPLENQSLAKSSYQDIAVVP